MFIRKSDKKRKEKKTHTKIKNICRKKKKINLKKIKINKSVKFRGNFYEKTFKSRKRIENLKSKIKRVRYLAYQ